MRASCDIALSILLVIRHQSIVLSFILLIVVLLAHIQKLALPSILSLAFTARREHGIGQLGARRKCLRARARSGRVGHVRDVLPRLVGQRDARVAREEVRARFRREHRIRVCVCGCGCMGGGGEWGRLNIRQRWVPVPVPELPLPRERALAAGWGGHGYGHGRGVRRDRHARAGAVLLLRRRGGIALALAAKGVGAVKARQDGRRRGGGGYGC